MPESTSRTSSRATFPRFFAGIFVRAPSTFRYDGDAGAFYANRPKPWLGVRCRLKKSRVSGRHRGDEATGSISASLDYSRLHRRRLRILRAWRNATAAADDIEGIAAPVI